MTDEELAARLEWHAKHGETDAALLKQSSERLYAIFAHNALLKASLAQAEREATSRYQQILADIGAEFLKQYRDMEDMAGDLPALIEELGRAEGALTRTAPERIWLQAGDNDRSLQFHGLWDEITWCAKSVGGCEIEYVRADLAKPAASAETDLLEALQSILQIDAHGTPLQDRLWFWNAGRPALDKARAAIAKATGKEAEE